MPLQQRNAVQGAFDKGAGAPPVPFKIFALDAARVRADAHGNTVRANAVGDQHHLLFPADVPWVDADLIRAVLHREHGELCRKMDICHDGERRTVFDGADGARVRLIADGDAHDLAPRLRKAGDLRRSRFYIGGVRRRHRLHAHGRPAAKRDPADVYLFAHPAHLPAFCRFLYACLRAAPFSLAKNEALLCKS